MQYEIRDRSTTKTYALVGFIFYFLVTLTWLLFLFLVLLVTPWSRYPSPGPSMPSSVQFPIFTVGLLGIPVILLNIIFTGLAYSTYKKIDEGRYMDARTSSLILGIFGLIPVFGGFLGGIFFLLAYGRLGDVPRMSQREPSPFHTSSTTFPARSRFCPSCGGSIHGNDRFCSNCGTKLP